MMQALILFPIFTKYFCLSLQFTYKEIKNTQPHRRHCSFSKGMICPFLNNCPLQANFCLCLHSVTSSVLTTVILQLPQALRNYTGKCHPHLSEILMSVYLWHCAFPQDVSDQPQNFDSDIPCFPLKLSEITFDLSVRKQAVSTEDARNKNAF